MDLRARLSRGGAGAAMLGASVVARSVRGLESLVPRPASRELEHLRAAPPGEHLTLERPDGAVVHVYVAGEGPTVVLTHGYALHAASWNLVAEDLVERGHRVVSLDWRAHGPSTDDDGDVTTDELVGDLRAVLEHLEVEDAVLVGHSTGGYVSLAMLVDHPEEVDRLTGLVLVASLAGDVLKEQPDERPTRSGARVAPRVLGNEPLRLLLAGFAQGLAVSPAVSQVFLDQFGSADHTALRSLVAQLAGRSYYDELPSLEVPTVVVCGEDDRTTPPAHSEAIAERITGATTVWVPDAGHLLNWQHPERLVEVVTGMVDRDHTGPLRPDDLEPEEAARPPEGTGRAVFVLNPASGTHDADETERAVLAWLDDRGWDTEVRRTQGEGDARSWARESAASGDVDLVVVAGGDGTVREVVSGVVDASPRVPIGIIPTGTANLLARALGIPVDDVGAAARVASDGEARDLDVLHLVDRDEHAVLMVDAGFDAELVRDSTRGLKDVLGPAAYVVSGIRNMVDVDAVDVHLEFDEDDRRVDAHSVLCLNVGRIGETVVVDRDIEPDDGLVHVAVLGRSRPWEVLATTLGMVVADRERHPGTEWLTCERLRITADPPLPVQVDGDPAGETPVELELLPSAVTVVVPRA